MQNHYEPSGNIPTWLISTKYTANNGVIGLTFTPNAIRSHAITITATDDYGQSATTTWTIDAVPAEIKASMSGGSSVLFSRMADIALSVSKPNYAGQFNVSVSKQGNGTLSHSTFTCSNGSNTTIYYTPTSQGSHTITATITDSEGKRKEVSHSIQTYLPKILSRDPSQNNIDLDRAKAEIFELKFPINLDQYPSGATFSVTAPGGSISGNNTNRPSMTIGAPMKGQNKTVSVTITDMYGQTAKCTFVVYGV